MESKLLKRILSFAIVVVMVMSMLPTTAFAAEEDELCAECPHCNKEHKTWLPWTGDELTEGGHYYVQGDKVTLKAEISITKDVVIDLNGNTIQAPDKARAFHISGGGKLTILDSSEDAAGNGTGTIRGGNTGIASGAGGVIFMEDDSRFYMYGGTLTGGKTRGTGSTAHGANYSQSGGVSYFYGGTISGGDAAARGGNISANGSSTMYLLGDVEVCDGTGNWAGNIYLGGGAKLYIADDARITGGNGESDAQDGANILSMKADIYIFGGTIEGYNTSSNAQYDIQVGNGDSYITNLYMYGGTVGAIKEVSGSVNVYGGNIKTNPKDWLGTCVSASFAAPEDNSTGYYQVTHTTATTAQPTCITAGSVVYSCATCDHSYTLPLAAKGHTYEVGFSGDCVTPGYETYECKNCDLEDHECVTLLPATGHDLDEQDGKEATCTQAGYEAYYYCEACETYFSDEAGKNEIEDLDAWKAAGGYIPALGHNTEGGTMEGHAPTCVTPGQKTYHICSGCNAHVYVDAEGNVVVIENVAEWIVIPADGESHKLNPVEAQAPTCTEIGWDAYEECEYCDYSTYEEKPALDHTWGDWEEHSETQHKQVCVNDPTHVEYADHKFGAYVDGKHTCEDCGYEAACVHNWVETGRVEADCQTYGSISYECSVCKETWTDTDEQYGDHKMTFVAANAPTCTKDGNVAHYHCSVCGCNFEDEAGNTQIEEVVVPTDGHDLDEQDGKEATCTQAGYKAYYHCSACDKYFADASAETEIEDLGAWKAAEGYIPALGHNTEGGTTPGFAQTCVTVGQKTYHICSGCNAHVYVDAEDNVVVIENVTEWMVIPADGTSHEMTFMGANAPTCTENGNVAYYHCSVCDKYFADPSAETEIEDIDAWKEEGGTLLPATGHNYELKKEIGKYVCSECEDTIDAIKCSGCNDYADWEDWDGKSNITKSGHYRLTQSNTLAQTIEVSEGVKMCIDLNGNTVQAPDADRAFHISGGGKLTIMDSSEDADGNGTGTIRGGETGLSAGGGGVIYMEGEESRFYMYGGTMTGGKTLAEGETTLGGNYRQNSGESYFYGGTISDGKAAESRGGNIGVHGGGKIYLLGDVKVLNGESGTWGGNIFITGTGTQLHIAEDALITGGISGTQQGANIHAEAASGVYIFGGKVEGFDKETTDNMSCDIQIGRLETVEGNLYIYGGTVGTIKKANKYANIYIYNGNIKSNPADWTADCADYCLEDGVYKVWHIAGETCEEHAAELAKADVLNAAIEHNYSEATCTTPKTCTKCNQTLGDVDSDAHNYGDWSNAGDGTHKKVCANGCGKDIVEAHKYEYTIDGATHKKVCVYGCGEDIVEAHKYKYTTDGNGKCECGATIVCEHPDTESSVTKEPTCTEKGEMTYNCPTCKKVWTEELAPKGHDYKSTVVAPDFDVEGYTDHECSRCGDNYQDNFVAAKVAVAIANGTKYESLEEALAQGGNVTLLVGVTVTETLKIEKDTVLDLGGFTVTANCNKAFEVYADATISNGTIIAGECCVETCKKEILNLNNVDLKATSANQQPLTIGGSENGTTTVNLDDVNIDAGTQGYAIISFVKTDLTIANSDISGYMALYIQGAAAIEITDSVLTSDITGNDVAGNATSAIVVEADNVFINMNGGKLETIGNNQTAIELRDVTGAKIVINSEIIAPSILSATEIEGNTVAVKAEYADKLAADGYASRTGPTDGMITAVKAVADVNGNKYEFFTVAWAAVNANGGTITLLDNVTVTESLTVNGTVTLDLNGYTLTGTLTLATEAAILNAAEGLGVISGVADMKVYYEDGTYKLVAIDAVAYNEDTGVFYVSVAKALSEATSGQTVKLIADDSVVIQLVMSGVTLDLNGNTLTAYYLVAASKGANIIDSTDGEGSVVITDDGSLDLRVDNESLVLKDGDTYTFVRSVVEHDWFEDNESAWDEDPTDDNVHVKFALATDNNALHALLAADGGKSENIVVRVRISWTDAKGENWEKYYVYADTALMQYAANFRSEHLYLNITGADIAETLTVTAELVKLDDEGKVVFCTEDVLMSYSAAE